MSATREEWLTKLANIMRDTLFKQEGVTFENGEYRISVGWPRNARKAIGECWTPEASAAGYREIFISPVLSEAMDVASTLAHELCHAALPFKTGHKRPFAKLAYAIGLVGKPTHTTAGGKFMAWYRATAADEMGDYPHSTMSLLRGLPKQTTRLIKVSCPHCEDIGAPYIVRMSAKTTERGTPICPAHKASMTV